MASSVLSVFASWRTAKKTGVSNGLQSKMSISSFCGHGSWPHNSGSQVWTGPHPKPNCTIFFWLVLTEVLDAGVLKTWVGADLELTWKSVTGVPLFWHSLAELTITWYEWPSETFGALSRSVSSCFCKYFFSKWRLMLNLASKVKVNKRR